MTWTHWVFRASHPYQPFTEFEEGRKTWDGISETFPEKIAAILMPNHAHLLLPQVDAADEIIIAKKLGGIMARVSKSQGISRYWQAIPRPQHIPDLLHLRRLMRYIFLNPCRKGLCSDPLEWFWSTYREIMGAVAEPTSHAQLIAPLLGYPAIHDAVGLQRFRVRFHDYVSGDPTVKVDGTPFPIRLDAERLKYFSLPQILSAAAASLRVPEDFISVKGGDLRPMFVHLAKRCGWKRDCGWIAEICGASPRTVRRILENPAPPGIESAEFCLSDVRFVNRGSGLSKKADVNGLWTPSIEL